MMWFNMSRTIIDSKEGVRGLCPKARNDPEGCPYGSASRTNCTDCQDVPIWYFDNHKHGDLGKPNHDKMCVYFLACAVTICPCELRTMGKNNGSKEGTMPWLVNDLKLWGDTRVVISEATSTQAENLLDIVNTTSNTFTILRMRIASIGHFQRSTPTRNKVGNYTLYTHAIIH